MMILKAFFSILWEIAYAGLSLSVLCVVAIPAYAGNLLDPAGTISGDCVNGFVCSGGDPVLCAVAVADQSAACAAKQSGKTVQDVLDTLELDKQLADIETTTSTVSLGTIAGAGGSCPANSTANVFGHTFVVDVAPVCDLAVVMGWFILLGSVLWAGRILGG